MTVNPRARGNNHLSGVGHVSLVVRKGHASDHGLSGGTRRLARARDFLRAGGGGT
jgi:hypothetical protein